MDYRKGPHYTNDDTNRSELKLPHIKEKSNSARQSTFSPIIPANDSFSTMQKISAFENYLHQFDIKLLDVQQNIHRLENAISQNTSSADQTYVSNQMVKIKSKVDNLQNILSSEISSRNKSEIEINRQLSNVNLTDPNQIAGIVYQQISKEMNDFKSEIKSEMMAMMKGYSESKKESLDVENSNFTSCFRKIAEVEQKVVDTTNTFTSKLESLEISLMRIINELKDNNNTISSTTNQHIKQQGLQMEDMLKLSTSNLFDKLQDIETRVMEVDGRCNQLVASSAEENTQAIDFVHKDLKAVVAAEISARRKIVGRLKETLGEVGQLCAVTSDQVKDLSVKVDSHISSTDESMIRIASSFSDQLLALQSATKSGLNTIQILQNKCNYDVKDFSEEYTKRCSDLNLKSSHLEAIFTSFESSMNTSIVRTSKDLEEVRSRVESRLRVHDEQLLQESKLREKSINVACEELRLQNDRTQAEVSNLILSQNTFRNNIVTNLQEYCNVTTTQRCDEVHDKCLDAISRSSDDTKHIMSIKFKDVELMLKNLEQENESSLLEKAQVLTDELKHYCDSNIDKICNKHSAEWLAELSKNISVVNIKLTNEASQRESDVVGINETIDKLGGHLSHLQEMAWMEDLKEYADANILKACDRKSAEFMSELSVVAAMANINIIQETKAREDGMRAIHQSLHDALSQRVDPKEMENNLKSYCDSIVQELETARTLLANEEYSASEALITKQMDDSRQVVLQLSNDVKSELNRFNDSKMNLEARIADGEVRANVMSTIDFLISSVAVQSGKVDVPNYSVDSEEKMRRYCDAAIAQSQLLVSGNGTGNGEMAMSSKQLEESKKSIQKIGNDMRNVLTRVLETSKEESELHIDVTSTLDFIINNICRTEELTSIKNVVSSSDKLDAFTGDLLRTKEGIESLNSWKENIETMVTLISTNQAGGGALDQEKKGLSSAAADDVKAIQENLLTLHTFVHQSVPGMKRQIVELNEEFVSIMKDVEDLKDEVNGMKKIE